MVSNHPKTIPSIVTDKEIHSIKDELNRILASKYFKSAKKMQHFLEYIIEKTIVGKTTELKQYTIGVEALSFDKDFDPDTNPAVRILGSRVRQRLNEYYKNNDDELIISIPKGSYIPEFEKNVDVINTINKPPRTACCPTIALVSFTDKTQSQATNRSLLEFTDSLATELSRFLCLQLVVCNPYADKDQSHLLEAEMKATDRAEYDLVLFYQKIEGGENNHKLIYRLVLVDTGEILWSDNYVITDQAVEKQDYVVGKIATIVGDQFQGMMHTHWSRSLLADENSIPEHSRVLVYFNNYTDNVGKMAFSEGVNACLEALDTNPNNVIANLIYATYCRREYVFGYGLIESPIEKGIKSIETAIRLHPYAPEARFVHGLLLFCKKDWKRSIEEFELARNITQNNVVIEFGVGFHLCKMDKWDEGLPIVKRAMNLSTAYPSYFHVVPFLDFYREGKYEQALNEAKKITTPNLVYGPLTRCISYAQLEQFDNAKKEFQEVLRRYPKFMEIGWEHVNRALSSEILTKKVWNGISKLMTH